MKSVFRTFLVLAFSAIFCVAQASELEDKVASLNMGLGGYVIGKVLTDEQKKIAKTNVASEKAYAGTYKFKDKNLNVIAKKSNDRVLIVYEDYGTVDGKKMKEIIGKCFIDYSEPTATAHEKMLYWSYDKNGKLLTDEDLKKYKDTLSAEVQEGNLADTIKTKNQKVDFDAYITVKLVSSQEIMIKENEIKDASVYLMLSSGKLLEEITSGN